MYPKEYVCMYVCMYSVCMYVYDQCTYSPSNRYLNFYYWTPTIPSMHQDLSICMYYSIYIHYLSLHYICSPLTKLRERSETRFQTYFEKEIGRLKNEYFKEAEVRIFFYAYTFFLFHTLCLVCIALHACWRDKYVAIVYAPRTCKVPSFILLLVWWTLWT